MLKIHILNQNKAFSSVQLAEINKAFNQAKTKCKKLISASDVDIVIRHDPAFVMPETGIGGRTPNTNYIDIPVNAKRNLDWDTLYLTICHELHHAMRQRKFSFPKTLLDAVVSEGLADQFEREINPKCKLPTYNKKLSKQVVQRGLTDLRKEKHSENYDYYGWFFGAGKYPNYFGYTLGNMIIEKYIEATNKKPSELVKEPTKSFEKYI